MSARRGAKSRAVTIQWNSLLGIVGSRVLEVAGLCVVAFELGRVEVLRGVLEGQAQVSQLDLYLVDRLLTEVADIQQVRFGALSELTDGEDLLTLQAVVGCLLYTSDAADDLLTV